MAITKNSRYQLTAVVQIIDPVSGNLTKPEFMDLRQRVTAKANDDVFVTASSAKQWSHHGLEELGDARHWWVIADLSEVIDPFEELVPGKQLRAPSPQRFFFNILAPENSET